jgi:DNA-directed RNA polymerase specialized sigma24 family protein
MDEASDSLILQSLPIVEQEVRRRMALGVPRGVDRSDVQSKANEALVVAIAKGTTATRLAVRHALCGLVRYEAMRQRHGGDIPEVEGAPPADRPASAEAGELALADLTARQMEAVWLVYYEGLSYAEAAGKMDLSVTDLGNVIQAAKKTLRKKGAA